MDKATYYEYSWSKENYYSSWQSIGDVTSYTVTGLSSIPHTFWVRGVNNSSYGPQSEAASVTPKPPVPGNLRAEVGDGEPTSTSTGRSPASATATVRTQAVAPVTRCGG